MTIFCPPTNQLMESANTQTHILDLVFSMDTIVLMLV